MVEEKGNRPERESGVTQETMGLLEKDGENLFLVVPVLWSGDKETREQFIEKLKQGKLPELGKETTRLLVGCLNTVMGEEI